MTLFLRDSDGAQTTLVPFGASSARSRFPRWLPGPSGRVTGIDGKRPAAGGQLQFLLLPARIRALRSAWKDVAEAHFNVAPCSNDTSSGSGSAFLAGTAMYSA